KIVAAAGGDAKNAMMLMLADKMEDLMKIQVEAIRDLTIDKVTVWDSGAGTGTDGKGSTANFISGLMKSVPPMNEIFEMAGMQLPEFLGKKMDPTEDGKVVPAASAKDVASKAKEVKAVEAPKKEAAPAAKAPVEAAPAAPAPAAAPEAPAPAAPAAPANDQVVPYNHGPIWAPNSPMSEDELN
ncbi:MAG: hypothetical protein IKR22_01870, partial [Clostridiales bacterium]|nr:hypothetical protein [Clostridiales bacterium]